MRNYVFIFLLGMLILCSCKKDEQQQPTPSKTVLLTRGGWVLTAYTQVRLSDGFSQDAYAPMSSCNRDDVYTFKADLTYEGSVGATKCSQAQPQVFQSGTWRFDDNETVLEREITSGSNIGLMRFTVVSISATELKLQLNDGSFNHNVTYSH